MTGTGSPVRTSAIRWPARPFRLSREEAWAAMLLARGWSRDRIGEELDLDRHAVDASLRRVLAELSLTSATPAEIAGTLNDAIRHTTGQEWRIQAPDHP